MRRFVLAAAILLGMAAPALAGGSTPADSIADPERTVPFAKKVERALAARGARVAIVGRIGRMPEDLPAGIEYTHVGFWVYSDIRTADGRVLHGYAAHNLYQDSANPGRSLLLQDYPVNFFGNVPVLEAGIIIPTPELQARLLTTISSPTYRGLHQPVYSVVANPHRRRYQNCTNFVLEVLVASIYQTSDRADINANIRAYFTPKQVRIGGLQRAFGPIFVTDFRTDDHDGPIHTATFGSIASFLENYGLAQEILILTE